MATYKMIGIKAAAAATKAIDPRVESVQIEWNPRTDRISTYTPSADGWFEPDDPENIVIHAHYAMTMQEIREGLLLLKSRRDEEV